MVLKNIKDEKINDLKLEVKDNGEEHLQIDFYDLKAYVPPKLQNLIKDDNFKFSIEQHVYSKEFLNFICNLSEFKELGDFNPYALPTKIYTQPVDPEFKAMLGSCLDANLLFLMDVFTKTEDNQVVCRDLVHLQVLGQHQPHSLGMSREGHAYPAPHDLRQPEGHHPHPDRLPRR
jgi:hypothetical protein